MVSGNVRVLWLTAFLFALITGVQYFFGAVVVQSAALTEDCYCMGVDAFSYFLNIGAVLFWSSGCPVCSSDRGL